MDREGEGAREKGRGGREKGRERDVGFEMWGGGGVKGVKK